MLATHAAGEDAVRFALRGDDAPATAGCLATAIGDVAIDPGQADWALLHPVTR